MNEADILEKAADLIETVGHCKDTLYTKDDEGSIDSYCLTGGLLAAQGVTFMEYPFLHEIPETHSAVLVALSVEKFGTPHAEMRLVRWNNDPDTKASEVVDLLKATAKNYRNRAA